MDDSVANKRPRQGEFDATELTSRFAQLVSSRRMTELAERSKSPAVASSLQSPPYGSRPAPSSSSNIPPSYSSLRNLPKVASPPQDPASIRFRNLLVAVSVTPLKYENPGLLDEALSVIPLETIWAEAEEESQILQAQAASIGENEKPEWGYQDCVIRSLLK
jgi:peptide-N4-(N-acetyl-beta-glucosaminyl)asparagine amidase